MIHNKYHIGFGFMNTLLKDYFYIIIMKRENSFLKEIIKRTHNEKISIKKIKRIDPDDEA